MPTIRRVQTVSALLLAAWLSTACAGVGVGIGGGTGLGFGVGLNLTPDLLFHSPPRAVPEVLPPPRLDELPPAQTPR